LPGIGESGKRKGDALCGKIRFGYQLLPINRKEHHEVP